MDLNRSISFALRGIQNNRHHRIIPFQRNSRHRIIPFQRNRHRRDIAQFIGSIFNSHGPTNSRESKGYLKKDDKNLYIEFLVNFKDLRIFKNI